MRDTSLLDACRRPLSSVKSKPVKAYTVEYIEIEKLNVQVERKLRQNAFDQGRR